MYTLDAGDNSAEAQTRALQRGLVESNRQDRYLNNREGDVSLENGAGTREGCVLYPFHQRSKARTKGSVLTPLVGPILATSISMGKRQPAGKPCCHATEQTHAVFRRASKHGQAATGSARALRLRLRPSPTACRGSQSAKHEPPPPRFHLGFRRVLSARVRVPTLHPRLDCQVLGARRARPVKPVVIVVRKLSGQG